MASRFILITLFILVSVCRAGATGVADSATVAAFKSKVEAMTIDSAQKAKTIAAAVEANERIEKFCATVTTDIELSVSPRQHNTVSWFNFVSLIVEPVKRLKIGISYINYLGLRKQDGVKDYLTSDGMGGSVSYRLYQPDPKRMRGIEAKLRYGHSIGNGDLKYNLYDIGVQFYEKLGMGFRCVDSHTDGIRNAYGVYFSWSIL